MSRGKSLKAKRREMQRRNHPGKGSAIKAEPIRDLGVVRSIMVFLKSHPRNLCLFTLGINTAFRANELVSLKVSDVMHLKVGDELTRKQSKNDEYRQITLNGAAYDALQNWLAVHPDPRPEKALFISQKTKGAISVSYVSQMVKAWCRNVGANGHYSSHSLRKTWGYHQRVWKHTDLSLLVRAFGHSLEAQTLEYLGILPQEIRDLYLNMELSLTSIPGTVNVKPESKEENTVLTK